MKKGNIIYAADLFCGAGGTSSGLIRACRSLGMDVDLLAINHWDIAIKTHNRNHPGARHFCESLDNINPRVVVPGGRLDLLVASPECTHHSIARGGKPCSDQSRSTAWHILRWAEALYVDNILIENVKEFVDWGPIGANGKPMKSKKGATFMAFRNALESLGYKTDWAILNAANYGDPTTRRRFFMIARRGNRKIKWPEITHSQDGLKELFGSTKKWKPAREIIDWSIKGKSIFNRKKPLAKRTIDRIAHGLKKYSGINVDPFLVMLYGTGNSRSIKRPLPTITANGQHIALCEPFLLPQQGGRKDQLRVCSLEKPMPTITTAGAEALVQPFLTIMKGQSKTRDISSPLPTVTTNPHLYLCEPFLIKYYGRSESQPVNNPLDTITTKDRFGLVQGELTGHLDITLRMLEPHELAAAMSFDQDYEFAGTKTDKVRQIGNAVPVRIAEALCKSLLAA
jgi:DNA (cytosine-5)-methyltransferase 1